MLSWIVLHDLGFISVTFNLIVPVSYSTISPPRVRTIWFITGGNVIGGHVKGCLVGRVGRNNFCADVGLFK